MICFYEKVNSESLYMLEFIILKLKFSINFENINNNSTITNT